jgi:GNAT superfamily N-acetyltransferase
MRNSISYEGFVLEPITEDMYPLVFNCDDDDINEFFQKDVLDHERELFTRTYGLYEFSEESGKSNLIVGLISFSNDSVRLRDLKEHAKDIPEDKRYASIPAVKIARLGIQKAYQRNGLGRLILNMTKHFFLKDNRTGCRLLTLDAYNSETVISFYQDSDFKFIYDKDKNRSTRIMFYDLTKTVSE